MWSVSYSAPEAWVCYVADEFCDETAGLHGYDPTVYLNVANVALMKLALQGVSAWTCCCAQQAHILLRELFSQRRFYDE